VSDECGDMAMNLHDAAHHGEVLEVRLLEAAGADVEEQRGETRSRPLHWAAHVGQVRGGDTSVGGAGRGQGCEDC
jgi:hypothetical protein